MLCSWCGGSVLLRLVSGSISYSEVHEPLQMITPYEQQCRFTSRCRARVVR